MKTPLRLRTAGVAALLAAGAAAAFVLWAPVTPAPLPAIAPARPAAPSPSVDARTAPAPSACRFTAGDRLAYRVALESETTQQVPGGRQLFSAALGLTGQLELEVLSTSSAGPVLLGRLGQLKVSGAGLDAATLAPPFLVQLDDACRLTGFARHASAARAGARNQQALLWETQFQARPTAQLTLLNGNGQAVATLERVGPTSLRRSLSHYESLWSEPAARDVPTFGVMGVELSDGPWFDSLSAQEELTRGEGRLRSTLTLTRAAPAQAFTADERQASRYVWENLLPRAQKADLVSRPFTNYDAERQRKVAPLAMAEALGEFADRYNRGLGVQSTWPELSAWFEVHPEGIRPAVKHYRAGGLPERAAGDFFLALGKARTPEAKAVLLELKRDDAFVNDSVRAMFALVVREDVGAELAREFASDIDRYLARATKQDTFRAGEAMLALSTMSGSRDDAEVTATSRAAVEGVLQRSGVDTEAARVALKAVGNMGEPSLLPLVAAASTTADVDTRKAAAWGFSRMPPADSEAAELEWLRRESNPFVKRELYLAIQQQHLNLGVGAGRELVAQTLADLAVEKSAYARQPMVRLVAQSAVAREPDVRRALVAQAKAERAKQSPLLNEFARILTPDEIAEVLR